MTALNPVLRRELTERWRGRRAFLVVTAYVAGLAVIFQLLYWVGQATLRSMMRWGGGDFLSAGPMLGRFLFENLLAFVLLIVLFIAPGYAAAQISGERERRSLALLQVTLLRPYQIVLGKLGAAVAWLVLLVFAAMPFAAAAFFLGGISISDLVRSTVYVVVLTVAIAAVGLGISSLAKRTTAAIVLTYGLVLLLVFGTAFASVVEAVVRSARGGGFERPLALYANPFYGLADAAGARSGYGGELPSVLAPFGFALPQPGPEPWMMVEERGFAVAPDGRPVPMPAPMPGPVPFQQPQPPTRTVWAVELALYLAMGALGLAVATRRVRAGAARTRRRTRGPSGGAAAGRAPPGGQPAMGEPAPGTLVDAPDVSPPRTLLDEPDAAPGGAGGPR